MNIDQQETDKFNALATKWWLPNGEFAPLHRINPLRLRYIIQQSGNVVHKQIIDVGCGGGILSEGLAKEGAEVTGLDMAPQALEVARQHAQEQQLSINYLKKTVEEHANTHKNQYDILTCMEMLEHVPNPASVIYSCSELVKPGGHLFFSTINRNIQAWLMLIVGAEYLAKMVPRGTHDVKKFIRPTELIAWIEQANLKTVNIIGIEYNLFNNTFKLSDNIKTNYILHVEKT